MVYKSLARLPFGMFAALVVMILCPKSRAEETWSQFRGPNASGVAASEARPPIEFGGDKNLLWRAELGSGHSSPSVWGGRVFVTTYDKEAKQIAVVCLDRSNGKLLWQREIEASAIERGHPSFSPSSGTPACDGERVVVYFGSVGLVCFSVAGERLWDIPMPLSKGYSGNATSPIIEGDTVLLYRGNLTDHFLLAVDKVTGSQRWKVDFSASFRNWHACAATPVVHAGLVIFHCIGGVRAHDIKTGDLVWQVRASTSATASPITEDDHLYVALWTQSGEPDLVPKFPPFADIIKDNDKNNDQLISNDEFPRGLWWFFRPEGQDAEQIGAPLRFGAADRDKNGQVDEEEWSNLRAGHPGIKSTPGLRTHGLISIRLGGKGDVTDTHVTLLEDRMIPEVPSPVYHAGRLFMVKNGGILTCVESETGKSVYRRRVGPGGTHYASPIIAAGRLYLTSGSGRITVIDAAAKSPQVLAKNEIGEDVFASPAVIGNVIYIRAANHLYAFADEQ